jgi:hypothetical protein
MVCLLASALYPLTWPFKNPYEYWIQNIAEHVMLGALYFANILWFFPQLYNRGRFVLYIIALIAAIYLLVLANGWIGELVNVDAAYIKAWSTPGHPYVPEHHWEAKWAVFLSVIFLGLSNIAAFSKRLQAGQLAFQISEKERINAELSFLKAQINPHFFFNTLHTIYSLTDTDPAAAKESLYTLSHMMRYVIYETKNDYTLLGKEVAFLEDYIKLMKTRVPQSAQIIFDKQPNLQDLKIAPMLLLPLVENAFKHGIRTTQRSYVFISVYESDKTIRFQVRNSLFNDKVKQVEESSGIGIVNTRRRLDLLYPGRYELIVKKDELIKEYLVTLILNTDDH